MDVFAIKNAQLLCRKFAHDQIILDKETEFQLIKKWCYSKDERSVSYLILSHLRLIHSLAYRFKRYGGSYQDLIQEGLLGLIKAANNFNLAQDCRFATYAKWWVLSGMQDYVTRNWSIVRIVTNSGQKQIFFRLNQLKKQLAIVNEDDFDNESKAKVASILKTTIHAVDEMNQKILQLDSSLDQQTQGSKNLVGVLSDESQLNQESAVLQQEEFKKLEYLLEITMLDMHVRESFVLSSRFFSDPPMTLAEIGKKLSLTKERIRQIEKIALRQLKIKLVSSGVNRDVLFSL